MLNIQLLYLPHPACQGKAVTHRWRRGDGSDLIRSASDGIVLGVLEYRIKLKGAQKSFTRKTYDQRFFVGHLQKIVLEHRKHQHLVILLGNADKGRQGKDPFGKPSRRQLAR